MDIDIDQIIKVFEESKKEINIDYFRVSQKVWDELESLSKPSLSHESIMLMCCPVVLDENMPTPPGWCAIDKDYNAYVPTKNGIIKVPMNPYLALRRM